MRAPVERDPGESQLTERLQRLREMLAGKRGTLEADLERTLGTTIADDRLSRQDEMIEIGDRAVTMHGADIELGVAEMRRAELRQVNEALRKLEAGDYGTCEECATEIDEHRLEIVPFAALCVECKQKSEALATRLEPTGRGFRAGFRDVREERTEPEEDDDDEEG